MHMRGRTVCPTRSCRARETLRSTPVPLSVGWGRMGRMSEESLPQDAGAQGAHAGYDDTREEPGEALPAYAERVLDVAELIPPGRVMTYGDVAEWLEEGGPRQVGRVMALYGGAVAWWRVVRADGVLLPGHEQRALGHYRAEGTPLKEASRATEGHLPRLDMRRARWDGGERAEGHT
ncbi:6-O-methylguanine DNA methyltransferase [Streptomyces swartbergensis]|uniref:6-O-methylguanine DNA methyltransferase n=2 Tax=Streptomyces swartbergensis TaxID=487165 RepID=A0A243RW23_9ACTN|nr:6-O-methylguanine DNA methyltransferase [Streptomyces swartbergensis]